MVENREFLDLQLNSYILMSIAKMFPYGENSKEFTREFLIVAVRKIVEESINLYREDFAIGMKQALTKIRQSSFINSTEKGVA